MTDHHEPTMKSRMMATKSRIMMRTMSRQLAISGMLRTIVATRSTSRESFFVVMATTTVTERKRKMFRTSKKDFAGPYSSLSKTAPAFETFLFVGGF